MISKRAKIVIVPLFYLISFFPDFEQLISSMKNTETNVDWDSLNIFNWNGLRQLNFNWMVDFFYPYGGLIWQHSGLIGSITLWLTPAVVSYIVIKKESNFFFILVSQLSIIAISQIDILKFARYAFPLALLIFLLNNYLDRIKFQLIVIFISLYSFITLSDGAVALIICMTVVLIIQLYNYFVNKIELYYIDYIISGAIILMTFIVLIISEPQRYSNLFNYWLNIGSFDYGQRDTPYLELKFSFENETTLKIIIFLLLILVVISKLNSDNIKNPNYIILVTSTLFILVIYNKDFMRPDMRNTILMCLIVMTPNILNLVKNNFSKNALLIMLALSNLGIATNYLNNSYNNLFHFKDKLAYVISNSNEITNSKVIRNAFFDKSIQKYLSQDTDLKELESIIGSNSVYVLGHNPILYNYFKQSKWIMNLYDLSPYPFQIRLVEDLSKERTRFIIRPRLDFPPVDNIDYRVRVPLIYKHVFLNYSPVFSNKSYDLFEIMEKDDNVREIDFGTNIDLGAIPAKSSYLKANQCKEIGSGCTRILDVLVKENKDNDPKINIIIKSGLVEYKLSFNRVKNVYKYSVNLQNLWFDHEKNTILCPSNQLMCSINKYKKMEALY
jgi:hypothetical protein